MNEKQQQLLFDKGITNVPSDALCSDNALDESLGMVYDNGEHRVIQKPNEYMTESGTIMFVHKSDDWVHYITLSSNKLRWRVKDTSTSNEICSVTGSPQVTAIGKTLIVNDSDGIRYFLWKTQSGTLNYHNIGVIPAPKPEFQMCKYASNANPSIVSNPPRLTASLPQIVEYAYRELTDVVKHTQSFEGIFKTSGTGRAINPGGGDNPWEEKFQNDYNNLVVGCYSANKKAIAENKCFCNPFFVRIALELYDGSYYHIGAPVLMLPAVVANSWARLSGGYNFTLYTICRQLAVKQLQDYTEWGDIVKDVVLFVTDDIDVNETTMDIPIFDSNGTFTVKGFYSDTVGGDWGLKTIDQDHAGTINGVTNGKLSENGILIYHYNPFKSRENSDIDASIKGASVFYKLCSLGVKAISDWTSTREKIEKHTLENITTQDQLTYDDYFSACPIKGTYMYAYNSRLNLANVSRGFFSGYNYDAAYDVDIEIDGLTKRVSHTGNVSAKAQCFYFFYPDPRAKKCGNHVLTEHQGLHGSYYFKGIASIISEGDSADSGAGTNSGTPTFSGNYESLPNYIITSEVNNPYLFKAEGYNRIGTGEVIAITANTNALSEGQFGQHPLIVFSKSGIWAMHLDGTGLFVSIDPLSREVCNNQKSVTQTDSAIFFSSNKGLMVVVGSQVKCVSEQLSGKTGSFSGVTDLGNFTDFLKDAIIAYDYRDSLLWLFDGKTRSGVTGLSTCWVYSIRSGTFSHFDNSIVITNVANDYPDTLLQTSSKVYSLIERENINVDTDQYEGTIITRPMKLENALALKSIMQIKHIRDFDPYSTSTVVDGQTVTTQWPQTTFRMYASNNLKNWVELTSLRGTPWKYYRFRYDFAGLKATDRFAGTMLITQERRTDKLR